MVWTTSLLVRVGASGDAEGAFDHFHSLPEGYLVHRSCQSRSSATALFAFDQAGAGELRQDTGEYAPWDLASAEILSAVVCSPNQAR